MPIAHLLELWKGIEVEPMETEVSGGGVRAAPLSRWGSRLGAAPHLAGAGGDEGPSLLAAGGEAGKPVAPRPEGCGGSGGCPGVGGGLPPARSLLHPLWAGLRGLGRLRGEGAPRTDGNLQSRLSAT
uniref:Uncharacterized protein n=1 Tax=Otus sunia TaxID=257818 RepID=A0A8C8AHH4_9STRI